MMGGFRDISVREISGDTSCDGPCHERARVGVYVGREWFHLCARCLRELDSRIKEVLT